MRALALVAAALVLVACGSEGPRLGRVDGYAGENVALLEQLPLPPGATRGPARTDPVVQGDGGEPDGWSTVATVRLSEPSGDASEVLGFYERELDGWEQTEVCCAGEPRAAEFRREEAIINVTADDASSGTYEIAVDAHGTRTRQPR